MIVAVVAAVSVWASIAPPPLSAPEPQEMAMPLSAPRVTGPPVVEPLKFKPVSPETALQINAAIPFSTEPNPAAAPFLFTGAPADLPRATDCLAAAAYFEAGADSKGRRAVAQVILNRLRHPAFPKTVCGVVFQGAERATGCQFTFTCDGALARPPAPALWDAARNTAAAALAGAVFAPVGHATHYHTDWVTPYWSGSLDKIAAVETHIFFRWKGWWGTPRAFAGKALSVEPLEEKIAEISEAHRAGAPLAADAHLVAMAKPNSTDAADPGAGQVEILFQNAEGIAILADSDVDAASFPAIAASFCGARNLCKVRIWTDRPLAPVGNPISARSMSAMSFSYLRNQDRKFRKEQWNCAKFLRKIRAECLSLPFAAAMIS
ncbi:cell wall hydrolase [Sphingobium boeckii]|uniref:Cell wall hydrolase SleB domain-containing protein n=1 Tax=Sphingobium boeckii TaxID=1082345 RepID=A0A7W9AHU1_9SPHN|nr:cell wall hydrolase [Sphingobium boeckii]MBB5685766.1 hypothetical protein [Sphingobium boeckii]